MKTPEFILSSEDIHDHLSHIAQGDAPQTDADRWVRAYYSQPSKKLLWIDKAGADGRADTLLHELRQVNSIGLSEDAFGVANIQRLLERLRSLDVDASDNHINAIAAQLEYRLTKACMRYCVGQRFGFLNPNELFNKLDVEKEDSVRQTIRYRQLFGMRIERPTAAYSEMVRRMIVNDSVAALLHDVQPTGAYYVRLQEMLRETSDDSEQRIRILCNMERSRWRLREPMDEMGKHIVVNIPAYHLYAYGLDTVLHMRVVCGAQTTKTPLLDSEVEWFEVNPRWVIPSSIVEKDVIRHVGDSAYFARNKYEIFERATNKQLPVHAVSAEMLLSGKYRVSQQSGADNSLGRIVFRFKNPFSVFLHYTANPAAFQRQNRAISHGCVRVARPFELAQYVLDGPDEWLLDRIRISMDLAPQTERGMEYLRKHRDDTEHKLVSYVPVQPHIPIYIIYHTLWPDESGTLRVWPDIYGYDQLMWSKLKFYLQ